MITEVDRHAARREEYETQGYLHVRGILPDNLIERLTGLIYAQFEAQAAIFHAETGVRLADGDSVRSYLEIRRDDAEWFAGLSRSMQHLIKGEFPLEVRLREEFLAITEVERLNGLLTALLGDPGLRMHYPPMLRFKVPGAPQHRVPMHQDAPYFPHLQNFANVWIPFCSITPECGGVNVLPGSHKLGTLPHQETVIWGNYVPQELIGDRLEHIHVLMEPGDVLIFGPHLLHYTHDNTSEQVRCSIDSRWFARTIDTTRQYYDLESRRVVRMF